jgi:hypothetical protein
MELIDEWKGWTPQPASVEVIGQKLRRLEPLPLRVHCYEDVGYPWIELVFSAVISPQVVLDAGEALAQAGVGTVCFNSLRPLACSFLVGQAFDPESDKSPPRFPITRYGQPLEDIRQAWA